MDLSEQEMEALQKAAAALAFLMAPHVQEEAGLCIEFHRGDEWALVARLVVAGRLRQAGPDGSAKEAT